MSTNDVKPNTTYIYPKLSNNTTVQGDSLTATPKTNQGNGLNSTGEKIFNIEKLTKVKPNQVEDKSEPSEESSLVNPNSLISISKEVLKYLDNNRVTKGTDVTQYILLQLKVSQDDKSFKNIQRRVYDAINVMNAIGILHKDKNSLIYKGHNNFKKIIYKSSLQCRNSVLKDKIAYKKEKINSKQHELMALSLKVINYLILVLFKPKATSS
jgi:hypothetical protein